MNETSVLNQSVIEEFTFDYNDIVFNEIEIIHLLGYDDENVPDPVLESINNIFKYLPDKVNLRGGFKIFPSRKVKLGKEKFEIENKIFNSEKIITSHLKDVDTIAFMVATIGDELENLSKSFMSNNEMLNGYIADKIASELVERTADFLETKIQNSINQFGYKITNRYSPGYCGWNVKDQHKIFSLLPKNFCGITLTEGALMVPIKSISAVVGIGKEVERKDYECSICDIEFCYKRERNAKNI